MSFLAKVILEEPQDKLVIPRTSIRKLNNKTWAVVKGVEKEIQGQIVNEMDFEVTEGIEEGDPVATFFPDKNSMSD